MSQLLETIRLDPQTMRLPLLPYHIARMKRSQKHFWGQTADWDLEKILFEAFGQPQHNALRALETVRCRVLYEQNIQQIEFLPYQKHPLSILELLEANSLNYAHKYANRDALNALKNQSKASDVLIIQNGLITDITYGNVAFWDGTSWLTPARPLLKGTKRAQLLHTKEIVKSKIQVIDLHNFTKIKIFNAMIETAYNCIYTPPFLQIFQVDF